MSIQSLVGQKTKDHLGIVHTVTRVSETFPPGLVELKADERGDISIVKLSLMILHEDITEREGIEAPFPRLSCHWCIAWATKEHLASQSHRIASSRSN